ncbi:MAG: DHHA2 domain-containing protein [Chloroflexota bacterium]
MLAVAPITTYPTTPSSTDNDGDRMKNPETILVIGHRNPDTDAIASAVGYAWLLNTDGTGDYLAGRAGEINAQTAFALQRFAIEPPPLISDVWGRVRDIAKPQPSLRKGQTLLEACRSVARTRRPAPILDENDIPIGLLSGAELFAAMAEALGSASVLALAKDFDRLVETAVVSLGTVLEADEHIRDIIGQALRTEQDDFLVVDEAGRYLGLCRKAALLAPPHRQLIMVDHNEPAQSIPGLEDAELLEVLDHHRLGNAPTVMPIRFRVEPVGSCSTLVAERGIGAGNVFAPPIAGLLLCGILSDTLVFRSPTTTDRDREAALRLTVMAGLVPAQSSEKQRLSALTVLGQDLLAAGAGLGTRSADEVVNSDLKYYNSGGLNAGIAQVEVANFRELAPRLDELYAALDKLATSNGLALALLMVTDVVDGNSQLVVAGQPRVIAALPYAHLNNHTLDAPEVVSRKKQLLPAVLAAMSQTM